MPYQASSFSAHAHVRYSWRRWRRTTPTCRYITTFDGLLGWVFREPLESNMVAFWQAYGRPAGRWLDERSDRVCVMTGIPEPLFNAVFRARLTPDAVETTVAEIRLAAAQWNVPLFWWLTPTTTPPGLGDMLLKHGFIHAGTVPAMAVDLARLDTQLDLSRALTIKVAEDSDTLDVWADIAAVRTGFSPPAAAMVRMLEQEVGLQPANALRRYVLAAPQVAQSFIYGTRERAHVVSEW